MKHRVGCLDRCLLRNQEYEFTITYMWGKHHGNLDYFPRCTMASGGLLNINPGAVVFPVLPIFDPLRIHKGQRNGQCLRNIINNLSGHTTSVLHALRRP